MSLTESLFDLGVGDFVSDLLERLGSESLRVDLSSSLSWVSAGGRFLFDFDRPLNEDDRAKLFIESFFGDLSDCSLRGMSSTATTMSLSKSLFDLGVGGFVSDLLERLGSESLRIDLSSPLRDDLSSSLRIDLASSLS